MKRGPGLMKKIIKLLTPDTIKGNVCGKVKSGFIPKIWQKLSKLVKHNNTKGLSILTFDKLYDLHLTKTETFTEFYGLILCKKNQNSQQN